MLVFALLYGVRPSSNGPHFAELEDEERKREMSTHLLPGTYQGLVRPKVTRPGASRGRGQAPVVSLHRPPCPAFLPTLRAPGHPQSSPTGQGLDRQQLEPLSFVSLLRIVFSQGW